MNLFLEIVRKRKKSVIAVGVLFLTNALLYFLIMHFQAPRLEKLQTEWLETRQRPYSAGNDKSFILSQGKKDLSAFYSQIPPKKDFMRVVAELFEIASSNGLSIGSVAYKPELIPGRDILVYGLTFSVSGNYAAVKSFFSDIERSPNMVLIDNISLAGNDSSPNRVDASVRLSAFFRTEKS